MNVHDLLAWSGPALDALVLIGLAVTWVQLRRDPTVAWHEYEERLRELQESLRLLVVQAEGEARDLDRRLAAHAEQLGGLADSPADAPAKAARSQRDKPRVTDEERRHTPRPSDDEPPPLPSARKPEASLAERVQQLAAAQNGPIEIGNDGTIQQGLNRLGKVRVATVTDLQQLDRAAGSAFAPGGQAVTDAPDGTYDVQQGALESTNASPVTNLVALIETMRGFEAYMTATQRLDQVNDKVITDVARV